MSDATCTQVEEMAAEYALGILPPGEAREVSVHLSRCRNCRREIDELRAIGDQLLDIVPDTEPPLGFDLKVLEEVGPRRPVRPPRHLHIVLLAVAAAAVLISVAAVLVPNPRHHTNTSHPADLTAALEQGTRQVGSVYVDDDGSWLFMSVQRIAVHQVDATEPVTCQLVEQDGTVRTVGTFDLVDGNGSWGATVSSPIAWVAGARLTDSTGTVIASASFKVA